MPNNADDYKIVIGTFINNKFIWHDVESFDNLSDAYKAFKKYVQSQLKYSDEELKRVWDTERLDIELRKGKKLLNWIGVYAREVDRKVDEEIEQEEKKFAKDSYTPKMISGMSYDDLQREFDELQATRKAGVPFDKERMIDVAFTMSKLNDSEDEEKQQYKVFYDTDEEKNITEVVEVDSWLDFKDYLDALKKNGAYNFTVVED